MASNTGAAYGTGAELDAAGARRRIVPGESAVGGDVIVPTPEDTKKRQRIVSYNCFPSKIKKDKNKSPPFLSIVRKATVQLAFPLCLGGNAD